MRQAGVANGQPRFFKIVLTIYVGAMVVVLNDAEQRLAKYLAKARMAYDRNVGARATIYNETDALDAEIDSIGAEIAFCKLYNCYPDLDTDHFGIMDAILPTGDTVDVKQTRLPNGRLLVKVKARQGLPDFYALMIGKFPEYRLAGQIAADRIIRDERIDRSLNHPAYAARQDELERI